MDSKIKQTEVHQFSSWNTKLNQLLNEADEQNQPENSIDSNKNDPAVKNFIDAATDLQFDLYALSVWRYPESWDSEEPANETAMNLIEKLADYLDTDASSYTKLNSLDIIQDRLMAVAIYNAISNQLLFFYADTNGVRVQPDGLTLNKQQKNEIKDFFRIAKSWSKSLPADYNHKYKQEKDFDWEDTESELLNAFSLKPLPAAQSEIPWKQLGPATVGQHYTDDDIRKKFANDPEKAERFIKHFQDLAFKAAERKKLKGVGRDKR